VESSLHGWRVPHRLPIQAAGAVRCAAAGTSSFGMVGLRVISFIMGFQVAMDSRLLLPPLLVVVGLGHWERYAP